MAVKTYSFRYRPTTAPNGTEDRVIACSHTTDACHAVINSSGQIGYYVSGSFTQLGTKTQSIDNIWHSYIVEKDELGNGCIYVDGQKIGCATNFPIDNVNQIGNFKTELKPETGRKPKVGLKPRGVSNIYTRPCCGDIDEIAYFDRQLSASEIVDLAQSGSLSKVYTLADYKITAMADDNIIATTEKPRYAENWRSIWDADQRTTALPTAIGSITVNGSYKSLANAANSAGIWTPTNSGTASHDYYRAVENWRQMFFVSSGGGTGFLLTSQLIVDTDISAMSPTLEARQSALMYAEDALRSAIMTQRQSNAETNAIDTMTEYADDLEAALRLQTDHALVFTTSATDPSTSWTAEQKLIHKGDYWRVNSSSPWKTWSGTAWVTVDDAQAQAAATAAASAASTAQTTANNAASVASSAQSTATTASNNATTALSTLSDIASDSKFTPVEKQAALNEWNIIVAEKTVNVSQATSFGISSTDYSNAFQALANYLNNGATWSSGTPSWLADLTTTQTIVGTDFRAAWKLYYDKRTELLNAIATEAKSLADTAQSTANVKRRVFTSTPTVPYDVGDLWVAGSTGDIKKCKTARATGSYTASEWEIASKYTDDTVAVTKSRTFIQTTAPSTGMQAGDYWLDSDDSYKPYVYKSGAWSVDRAMESAINAQTTADSKTTLWATLAVANSGGAVAGDMFMDSSLIYRCLTSAPDIKIDNSTRITSKNFGNLASAPTGAIANDRYYNTTNLTWYRYTGSAWTADGDALNTVTVTYTPKYLGRYEGVHPASYNNGDWWLVYDTDDSPIVRGFWYSNNGTPERVSKLSIEAQRKYKGVGLEDVLYASNNGYALLSGVYDPVAVYGVTTMELLAVNRAFINKLMVQELTLKSTGKIKSENFVSGESGFQLQASDGSAEFNAVTMRGKVVSQEALFTKDYEMPGQTVWQEDITDVTIDLSIETPSAIATKINALINTSFSKQMFDNYENDGTRSGKLYFCTVSSNNTSNSMVIYSTNVFGEYITHIGQYVAKYTNNAGVVNYIIGSDLSSEYGGFIGSYERLLVSVSGGVYTKYISNTASNKLIIKTRTKAVEIYNNLWVDGYVSPRCGVRLKRRGKNGDANAYLKTRGDVFNVINIISNGDIGSIINPFTGFYQVYGYWTEHALLYLTSSTTAEVFTMTRGIYVFNKDDATPIDNTYIFL